MLQTLLKLPSTTPLCAGMWKEIIYQERNLPGSTVYTLKYNKVKETDRRRDDANRRQETEFGNFGCHVLQNVGAKIKDGNQPRLQFARVWVIQNYP